MNSHWSADEIAILVATYRDHGPTWIGYESMLPGRTPRLIESKAGRLGMNGMPDPVDDNTRESRVMGLMREGVAMSEIDEMLHLPKGTAHDVVVERWKRTLT